MPYRHRIVERKGTKEMDFNIMWHIVTSFPIKDLQHLHAQPWPLSRITCTWHSIALWLHYSSPCQILCNSNQACLSKSIPWVKWTWRYLSTSPAPLAFNPVFWPRLSTLATVELPIHFETSPVVTHKSVHLTLHCNYLQIHHQHHVSSRPIMFVPVLQFTPKTHLQISAMTSLWRLSVPAQRLPREGL